MLSISHLFAQEDKLWLCYVGSPGILGMLYLQGMLSTVTTPDDTPGMSYQCLT